ncbi:hypothetical protein HanIR_Chr12g0587231 [Helianthus annuus]|nr:hypothetical protein HanIR_Chr12g0587231 [Helianthus annuus]
MNKTGKADELGQLRGQMGRFIKISMNLVQDKMLWWWPWRIRHWSVEAKMIH